MKSLDSEKKHVQEFLDIERMFNLKEWEDLDQTLSKVKYLLLDNKESRQDKKGKKFV